MQYKFETWIVEINRNITEQNGQKNVETNFYIILCFLFWMKVKDLIVENDCCQNWGE